MTQLTLRYIFYFQVMTEDTDKDQECGVYALFPLIFPISQWRNLVCLFRAHQRLLCWSNIS